MQMGTQGSRTALYDPWVPACAGMTSGWEAQRLNRLSAAMAGYESDYQFTDPLRLIFHGEMATFRKHMQL